MKKWLIFIAKLLFTAACLWWAFSGEDFSSSPLLQPSRLRWDWIALGIALGGLTYFMSALRWWILLRAQGIRITLMRSFSLSLMGEVFNLVTVGGVGGDATKVFLLNRQHPGRKLAVTMSLMVDHLVGLVAMSMLFFAVTAGRFEVLESQSKMGKGAIHFGWVFFGGGLVLIALMFVMASPWVHRRIHKDGKRMPKWEVLRRVPEIYDVYRRKWGHGLLALLVSAAMLPVDYAVFWCGFQAIGHPEDLLTVVGATPVVEAISALPVSVSGLGVREKTFEILMKDLVGMPAEVAVAGSLLGFACRNLLWALAGGLLFLRPSDRTPMKAIEEITHAEAEA
jgi:uncharacterized membrane protein YbhN (UPF0104 family)